MSKAIQTFMIISIMITLSFSVEPYNRTFQIKIPENVQDIEYSSDQKYIVLASQNQAYLYNGVTNEKINTFVFPTFDYSYSSLTFSQDSTKFTIGFRKTDGSA
jgi:hypothetical protein